MTGPRRRGTPDPADLAALAAPGVRAAPDVDPVLGAAGGGSPQQRAAPPVTTTGPAAVTPPAAPAAAGAGRVKEQFHGPADELALIRAAFWHTHVAEGHRNWSAFVMSVLRRERLRLEAEHHDGLPWPPVGKGELPTGRPLTG